MCALRSFLQRVVRGRALVVLECLALQFALITSCVPWAPSATQNRTAQLLDWRAAWVAAKSITTPQKIDDVLNRAHASGLNRLVVNVFYNGTTLFDSALAPMYSKVQAGFDPLAYLVPKAHERSIKVDAWFLAGRVGDDTGSPILSTHPDWGLVGPDGDKIPWLNFVRPDTRQFIRDLMLETVDRYGVDGLHFDYTRFPGPEWGFDAYSIAAFTKESGIDLNQLRYSDLPAYGMFEGNRLSNPSTATVLANFTDGVPAVTLNHYGAGQVIVLNWAADQRTVGIDSELMQRGLRNLLRAAGQVYVFHSSNDPQDYSGNAVEWLQYLGWTPAQANEADIRSLSPLSVLVLPHAYVISSETADALASFVERGGGCIFVDGPTTSIGLQPIQAITGMSSKAGYFRGYALIVSQSDSPLIPTSQRTADLASFQAADAQWKEFRRAAIDSLVQEVFAQVTKSHPDVLISVTITADQNEAYNKYLQDWNAWLQGGYVDLLVPRGYVDRVQDLTPILTAWKSSMETYGPRITIGLIAFFASDPSEQPKSAGQLLDEIDMVRKAGSNGFIIFDLGRMSGEQLSALKDSLAKATPPTQKP